MFRGFEHNGVAGSQGWSYFDGHEKELRIPRYNRSNHAEGFAHCHRPHVGFVYR